MKLLAPNEMPPKNAIMAHEVIRTVKGRQYRYLEESVRVPGKDTPRKRSIYLGPVHALTGIPPIDWKATLQSDPGAYEMERIEKEQAARDAAGKAEAGKKAQAEKQEKEQEKAPQDSEADYEANATPSSET